MKDNELQFDDSSHRTPTRQASKNSFADFLIKHGLAKDEQMATYILVGVIGVCVLVMVWMFSGGNENRPFTDTEIRGLEQAGSPSEITDY